MKPTKAGVEVLTGEQKIVHYLLEDVARLPIISNRAQELWLGIQLRAFSRLEGLAASRHGDLLPKVIESFVACHARLIDTATGTYWASEIAVFNWSRELLIARVNIYSLHRSRLRRLLDHVAKEPAQPQTEPLLQQLHEVVEWLGLLPAELLKALSQTSFGAGHELGELLAVSPEPDDEAYIARVRDRAESARQHLVSGYLRYALRVARNYAGKGLPFPDLAQYAFMGLMRAAERYDYRVNARFGTYATSWIWQSVTRGLADENFLIRLPVHIRDRLDKLSRMILLLDLGMADPLCDSYFLQEAGFLTDAPDEPIEQDPDLDELPGDLSNSALSRAEQDVRRLTFLTEPVAWSARVDHKGEVDDDPSLTVEECLETAPPREVVSTRQVIDRLMANLHGRERDVMEWRFGLKDGEERTLEEIGQLYGLTRERIRQVEAKAKKRLKQILESSDFSLTQADLLGSPAVWNIRVPGMPHRQPIDLIWSQLANDGGDRAWLDQLLADLPRSSWHVPRPDSAGWTGSRVGQLVEALDSLGGPVHYTQIIEAVNEALPARYALEETTGYNILNTSEREFLLLGEGVFSLVEWEKDRTRETQPQLPYCPLALPDPPDFEDALFESIFVGHAYLAQQPTAADFLLYMLRWSATDPTLKPWLRQGILSAYYLLGLIPYTFIYGGDNPRLYSTLPDGDIQALRRYCLDMLTARLVAMPEFWWVLQGAGPARPVDVGEQLAELHPQGLDDARQRLYLLNSLGAVVRLPNGAYRLTPLGEACAAAWGISPDDGGDEILEIEASFDSELLNLGFF